MAIRRDWEMVPACFPNRGGQSRDGLEYLGLAALAPPEKWQGDCVSFNLEKLDLVGADFAVPITGGLENERKYQTTKNRVAEAANSAVGVAG